MDFCVNLKWEKPKIVRQPGVILSIFFYFRIYFPLFFDLYCIQNKRIRRVIVCTVCICLPVMLVNIFFIQGIYHFQTITFLIGAVLIRVAQVQYYLFAYVFIISTNYLRKRLSQNLLIDLPSGFALVCWFFIAVLYL